MEMKEKIEKPAIIIRQEFIDGLTYYINNSGLPLFVIEPILKDIYIEIKTVLQKQYELEKMQYEKSLKEISELQEHAQSSN
jgi:hypothetical protein